jgi:hypothetical protein
MSAEQLPLTDIFSTIVTADDAYAVINQINTLTAKLYQKTDKPFETIITDVLGEERGKKVISMLQSRQIDFSSIPALQDFFTELSKTVESAKIMQVTLAVEPDSEMGQTIVQWGREMFPGQHVVVDWQQDPGILGGIVVVYEGQYLDFSLKKQVDKLFTEKAADIKAMLA